MKGWAKVSYTQDEDAVLVALLRDGFGRVRDGVSALLEGADDQLLRYRPSTHANHIGWLIWHLSRVQDDHFVHLARALWPRDNFEQRWVAEGVARRFGLPYPVGDTGYGHDADQVAAFGMFDGGFLMDYHEMTHDYCHTILGRLEISDFQTIIDHRWNPPVSTAVRLVSVLEDVTKHLGQAEYIAGLYAARWLS